MAVPCLIKNMIDVSTGTNYSAQSQEQKQRAIYLSKIGVLIVLTLGSAFLLGQYLSYSFYQNLLSLPDIAIPLVISFAAFLTFFFHSVLFVQKKGPLVLIAVGSCAAIVVNFFSFTHVPLLIGIGACFLLFLYAAYSTKTEMRTRIKIQFVHALNSTTTKIILAIAILLATTFYGTFTTRELDENNFLLPRSVFVKMVPVVQKSMQSLFGNIDFQKSLRQIAEEKVQEAIIEQAGAEQAALVPASTRRQLVGTYMQELQNSFESLFGVELQDSVPLVDSLYDGLLKKFNQSNQDIKSVILLILAVLFVFSIQMLAVVVRIVLIPIAFLVYEILLRTKFAHIVYENTSKEVITL